MVAAVAWGASSPEAIRTSAERAVSAIQKSQKVWAKQACGSCHHDFLPAIALKAARDHGIAVDEAAYGASLAHGFALLADLDRAVQYTHRIEAMDDAGRLVAAFAAGVRPSLVTAVYARHVAAAQKPDGHWVTFDDRPPQSYSAVTVTMLGIRAIQLYSHPSLAEDTKARVAKARTWLESYAPRDNEERADQLFGLAWAGADESQRAKLAQALFAKQQADGGWSSREGLASDAYSTGQALVALNEAGGVPTSAAAWQRGIDFLLKSQAPDGTWHVTSRLKPPASVSPPYFEAGHPYGHDQFVSVMGECWAVRALATALGPATPHDSPLREAVPLGVEPWAETMLFGTTDQARLLLDKKLDPNVATKAGTTALMMAMPSLDKAVLLLDRGAKINARSKSRYSALLVAAHYPDASPVIRALLGRGAQIALPKGAGSPMFGATPTMWAALAGNHEILTALKAAGDKADQPVTILGLFATVPLPMVAGFNDRGTLRALIDGGASVDHTDDGGLTALQTAAIANALDAAQTLIERGADVNHVDKKGMTPLLYAASIDFGDGAMIDLLLKAGAKPDAKTPEGLTARDLARKYGFTHLFKSLSVGP
jgi:ankyrin repeat protein